MKGIRVKSPYWSWCTTCDHVLLWHHKGPWLAFVLRSIHNMHFTLVEFHKTCEAFTLILLACTIPCAFLVSQSTSLDPNMVLMAAPFCLAFVAFIFLLHPPQDQLTLFAISIEWAILNVVLVVNNFPDYRKLSLSPIAVQHNIHWHVRSVCHLHHDRLLHHMQPTSGGIDVNPWLVSKGYGNYGAALPCNWCSLECRLHWITWWKHPKCICSPPYDVSFFIQYQFLTISDI